MNCPFGCLYPTVREIPGEPEFEVIVKPQPNSLYQCQTCGKTFIGVAHGS